MPQDIHHRIIGEVTKKILKPTGLIQRGRSRFWFADCGWYASLVEFQPHSGLKGNYLNLGVAWLWSPQEHWAFDISCRAAGFLEFKDENCFRNGIISMSKQAVTHCGHMRSVLKTPLDAFEHLKDSDQSDWDKFNLGILAGIANHNRVARLLLEDVIVSDARLAWQKDRNARARQLIGYLDKESSFCKSIEEQIIEARALLNLPIIEGPQIS